MREALAGLVVKFIADQGLALPMVAVVPLLDLPGQGFQLQVNVIRTGFGPGPGWQGAYESSQ